MIVSTSTFCGQNPTCLKEAMYIGYIICPPTDFLLDVGLYSTHMNLAYYDTIYVYSIYYSIVYYSIL